MVTDIGLEPITLDYRSNVLPIKLTYNSGWRGGNRTHSCQIKSLMCYAFTPHANDYKMLGFRRYAYL